MESSVVSVWLLGSNTETGDSKAMSIVCGYQHEGLKVNPVSSHWVGL